MHEAVTHVLHIILFLQHELQINEILQKLCRFNTNAKLFHHFHNTNSSIETRNTKVF